MSLACCVRGTTPALAPTDAPPSGSPIERTTAPQRRVASPLQGPQETVTRRLTFAEGTPPTPARKPSLRSESSGEASPAKKSSHDGGSSLGTGRKRINLF